MRYFLVIVLAAACSRQAESRWIDADRCYLGEPVHVGALTVWPIHSDAASVADEFLTLEEAQKQGLAAVREVSEEGEVGSLVVANKAELPILVCAGTVVREEQDRQIGQDFVIDPQREVTVDAFCVERGRWNGGEEFEVVHQYAITSARASAQYEKNQDGVWEDVAGFRTLLRNPGAVTIVFNSSTSLVDALQVDVVDEMHEKVVQHFATREDAPIGFAYAVDGKPVCVRTFAHSRLLARHLDGFIGTMCLEASCAPGRRRGLAKDVIAVVNAISAADEKVVATPGANENGYREGEAGWNASCYVWRGDKRVKLSEDWTAKQ